MADKITMSSGMLVVPDEPIIPYVEGDGTGVDIWPAAQLVMDAAAGKHGKTIVWKEVLAGQKAFDNTGSWLPSTCASGRCAGSGVCRRR
jgi:isocitrate dehydrogenase